MASKRPFFVIIPGASQTPSQYGYLSYLLQLAGYPTFSALLPSIGATGNVTAEDDTEYVRNKMLIPVLDHEEHDVIMIMHSYSGMPGSAASKDLGKGSGDGKDIVSTLGGQYPPHIRPDLDANLLRCDDRIPPLFQDVPAEMADVAAVSSIAQGMTSFTSPCPRATWDSDDYKGRVAFIRTLNDAAIPLHLQQMMIEGTGVDWIVKDIESGHSPHIAQPEKLTSMLVSLAKTFEAL